MKSVVLFIVAFACTITATAACSPNACGDAESHCVDAHTIESCGGSVDAVGQSRHSSTQSCPASTPFCVAVADSPNGTSNALCVASSSKSTDCNARPTGTVCNDGSVEECNGGYLVGTNRCNPSEPCVDVSSQAVCALSSTPDPSCSDAGNNASVCVEDGGASLMCYGGYAVAEQSCADAGETCNVQDGDCL